MSCTTAPDSLRQDDILIHKGMFVDLLLFFPRVETFTLSHGWDNMKAKAFINSVERVVHSNPILTSHLKKSKKSLYAVPRTYLPGKHNFTTVIDCAKNDDQPKGLKTPQDRLDFIDKHVSPQVAQKPNELKTKCPVFAAHLFIFADGYACYHVCISHAIVDAKTYYQIIAQISAFMNDENGKVTKIDWGNPKLTTLELPPEHYTKQDLGRIGTFSFLLGLIRSLRTKSMRKEKIWFLSKAKLAQKKKDIFGSNIATNNNYLSSHNVIIATISRLIKSSDEIRITMDARGRFAGLKESDGGNALKQFGLPCDAASDPNIVREAVSKGFYFDANQVLGRPTRKGRVCYTSTWMSGYRCIQGLSTICHVPSMAFIRGLFFDAAVVFPIDDECIGVVHNFLDCVSDETDEAVKLLKEISL